MFKLIQVKQPFSTGAAQVIVMMLCDFAYVTLVSDDDGNVIW